MKIYQQPKINKKLCEFPFPFIRNHNLRFFASPELREGNYQELDITMDTPPIATNVGPDGEKILEMGYCVL